MDWTATKAPESGGQRVHGGARKGDGHAPQSALAVPRGADRRGEKLPVSRCVEALPLAGMLTASCATASPSRPRLFWDACATLVCDDAGLRRYQSPPVRGVWPHRAAPPGGQGTVRRMTRAWVNVALITLLYLVLSFPAAPYCPRRPPDNLAISSLLADARFLHQKLAVMRNVGVPTGMLETVVADKSVARGPGGPGRAGGGTPRYTCHRRGRGARVRGARPPPAPPPMIRSNTLSANQRLKGLLSGRSASGFSQPSASLPPVEKALPAPVRTESPPPVPSAADKPQTPALAAAAAPLGVYGAGGVNAIASQDVLSGASSEGVARDGGAGASGGQRAGGVPPGGDPAVAEPGRGACAPRSRRDARRVCAARGQVGGGHGA